VIGNVSRRVREGDAGKGPQGTSPASYLGLKAYFYERTMAPRQRSRTDEVIWLRAAAL
jgi:hypothetical protein